MLWVRVHPSQIAYFLKARRFPIENITDGLYTFRVDGILPPLGYIISRVVQAFHWTSCWKIDHESRSVTLLCATLEERNSSIHATLQAERECNTFKLLRRWSGEVVPVYGPNGELVLSMERVAAPLFGIATFGVQLLACEQNQGIINGVWIAQRAKDKGTFPGMLDSTAGGGLVTGEAPFECLIREAAEEASLPEDLIRSRATACGAISYIMISDERYGGEVGLLLPGTQYIYEIQLPPGVTPIPGDGEAEEIKFMDVGEIRTAMEMGRFTPGHEFLMRDFLTRHGIAEADIAEDRLEAAPRMHRRFPFSTTSASSFKR